MNPMNRRTFLKTTAVTAGAIAIPTVVPSSVFGQNAPSEKIVMASIGTGGQGRGNTANFLQHPDVKVVAVCDADTRHLKMASQMVNEAYKNQDCREYRDFRELLAKETDVSAVCISTPDHWHGLTSIAAARAGKDIYCEKPLTNTVAEGKALFAAVKRYGRILQTGSHERSNESGRYACELVRSGKIGKLQTMIVNLPCIEEHHKAIINDTGDHPEQPIPKELDWDMWLGHTPMVPYNERRCHFYWRFIMNHGGGEMTDRGAHVIDIGQLGNGTDNTTPVEYWAKGELPKSKLYNTFFNFEFKCKYANGVEMIGTSNEPRGIKFVGTDGWIFVHIHGCSLEASNPDLLKIKLGPNDVSLGRTRGHHRNFLDCVKSRQQPFASAEVGYHTATICHLLNISMQLDGAKLAWDPATEQVTNNPQANSMLARPMRAPWRL